MVSSANTGDILDFAKDKTYVFDTQGGIYAGIDSGSFAVLNFSSTSGRYAKDKEHAYWFTWQDWGIVTEADPSTFTTNERVLPFARDKSHVFYFYCVNNHGIIATSSCDCGGVSWAAMWNRDLNAMPM